MEQIDIEIVKQPVIYYEVSVNVRNDGTRTTITHPVDIDADGVEKRGVSNGTTIIACVPPMCGVHTVYMVDVDGDKVFIGYDMPGNTIDWESEACRCAEMYTDEVA